ncbi:MAG TPA: hypothetical protein VMV31_08665 [Terriglobales bacterium]|nr:hypothetical protein [Terriglobales bacterium]
MAPKIIVDGQNEAVVAHRRAVASSVIAAFGCSLPDLRLLVFLSDSDVAILGFDPPANRGLHFPVNETTMMGSLPENLYELLVGADVAHGHADYKGVFEFDCAIYLHRSACEDDVGLTMTLAHELQHFVQFGCQPKLWKLHAVVMSLDRTLEAAGFRWEHIPAEREARIIGKRIAIQLCGKQRTRDYIEKMERLKITPGDAADWKFIQTIDVDEQFDLSRDMSAFFQLIVPYRLELESNLRGSTDLEFADVDLPEAFRDAPEPAVV